MDVVQHERQVLRTLTLQNTVGRRADLNLCVVGSVQFQMFFVNTFVRSPTISPI